MTISNQSWLAIQLPLSSSVFGGPLGMCLGEVGQGKQVILDHSNSNTFKRSRNTIVRVSKNKKRRICS